MLFNSYAFIFLFLPLVLTGFFQLARISHTWAAGWLTAASLFFYAYWNPPYVGLLMLSIFGNYRFGLWIAQTQNMQRKKHLLIAAITINLLLLAYYKYAHFFISNLNQIIGSHWTLEAIILPLGISFFTFTQIAFLVDTYQNKVREYDFVHYTLFVTYFPHLIAGPVLHHKEMMPQFSHPATYRFSYENLAIGLTIFSIGLFKKVIIADGISAHATPVFDAANAGISIGFLDAWVGALCFSLQLYFDFSGYSDMAIGLSRMFGILLPLNFHSPYKAANIIEFWRYWHMTLSRFLRDYLYIPLGGNRQGLPRRYLNLFITMLVGGLWHGAGWNFIIWGGFHGLYLALNHGWHGIRRKFGQDPSRSLSSFFQATAVLLTFLSVTVAWVFFRANTLDGAMSMVYAMADLRACTLPEDWLHKWGGFGSWALAHGVTFDSTTKLVTGGAINWILVGLAIVWFAPNTQEIMQRHTPALTAPPLKPTQLEWQPTFFWLLISLCITGWAVWSLSTLSEFLYFRF